MKKVMALLLSIAMMLSLTAVEVMAADEAVTLDLSEGSIVISTTGYKQGSGEETPFTGASPLCRTTRPTWIEPSV